MKQTVYLDFQILDQCSKDESKMKFILRQKEDISYLGSVAHIEELWGAIKNAKTDSIHSKQAARIKDCMEEIFSAGILNPTANAAIILKDESINDCLKRTKMFDTRETILKDASDMKKASQACPDFSKKYYCSETKWHDIWQEKCMIDYIKEINSGKNSPAFKAQIQDLYAKLCQVYGEKVAIQAINQQISSAQQEIAPGIFPEIQNSFNKIEYVIERLARGLRRCGFYRDRELRKINSGEYDTEHLIYATYCNYFITQDRKLWYRALAIYDYLNVPTKIILLPENFESNEHLI